MFVRAEQKAECPLQSQFVSYGEDEGAVFHVVKLNVIIVHCRQTEAVAQVDDQS